MAERDRSAALGALGGNAPTVPTAPVLQELLRLAVERQLQSWGSSPAKGILKDLGLAAASVPTGILGLGEMAGDLMTAGATGNPDLPQGPISQLNDQMWNQMSPAGKALSVLGVPEKTVPGVAAIPLSFWRLKHDPRAVGMGPGIISDIRRGIMQPSGKTLRYDPAEGGGFRPMHAGTEQTAIDRLRQLSRGDFSRGDPTVYPLELKVRDTLGTFDAPLTDPGAHWAPTDAERKALLERGIDAIIYRNDVEGSGHISLEALAPFTPAGEAKRIPSSEAHLQQALEQAKEAPYQLTLPAVAPQSSVTESASYRPSDEVLAKLGLYREGSEDLSTPLSWRDVIESLTSGTPSQRGQSAATSYLAGESFAEAQNKAATLGATLGANPEVAATLNKFGAYLVPLSKIDEDLVQLAKNLKSSNFKLADLKKLYTYKSDMNEAGALEAFLINTQFKLPSNPENREANVAKAVELFDDPSEGFYRIIQDSLDSDVVSADLAQAGTWRSRVLIDTAANLYAKDPTYKSVRKSLQEITKWDPYDKQWADAIRAHGDAWRSKFGTESQLYKAAVKWDVLSKVES